jgi:hypothetical protein
MKIPPKIDLFINALLMAGWGRRPANKVLVHADQGVQYTENRLCFYAPKNLSIASAVSRIERP